MNILDTPILQVANLLRAGKISSVELTTLALQQISKMQNLNAFITVFEDCLQQAEQADTRIKAGNAPLLCGIPMSIKDNICMANKLTTNASKYFEHFVPQYDAFVVQLLKQCGAVILGKNNMDEHAMGSGGQTSYFGTALNPYDTSKVAGGSSGGSAAAVAARMGYYSLGTDTGGSVRLPASFCGVFGLKPTYGLIGRRGIMPLASSLDHVGIFAKSAEDCAVVLQELAQHDNLEETSLNVPHKHFVQAVKAKIEGKRAAFLPTKELGNVTPCVIEMLEQAKQQLKSCGADIVELSLPVLDKAISTYTVISLSEIASNLSRLDGIQYGFSASGKDLHDYYENTRTQSIGAIARQKIALGTYFLQNTQLWRNAHATRQRFEHELAHIFVKCDCLVLPTAPFAAFDVDGLPDSLEMYQADLFNVPANLARIPAVSIPYWKNAQNMPIGLQLCANHLGEEQLFAFMGALEGGANV